MYENHQIIYFCIFTFYNSQQNRFMYHDTPSETPIEYAQIQSYLLENSSKLIGYACHLTHYHYDDAKDLYQETIYRSLNNIHKEGYRSINIGWFYTIMRNIYINEHNRKLHHAEAHYEYLDFPDNSPTPEESYSIEELYTAIARLCRRDGQIIEMTLQGYSYAEIAKQMNMKEGTVKSNIHRIKRILRKMLR